MYLRFTVLQIEPGSSRKTGMLVAAHELRDSGELSQEDESNLRTMLTWFNEHLKIPKLLSEAEHFRGLSWFKPEAKRPLQKAWALKDFLELHGIAIEVHKTADPGNIIYSDGWQVVAKPRKGQKVS
jgi:hypothetical protein